MFSSVLGGAEPASFAEATLNGWAPDGGMYWPTTIEPVTQETLVAWGGLSYPRLCEEVLKRFIRADDPDISRADLASIVSSAFDAFGSNSVLQLQPLTDGDGEDELHVVELWHGPTLAFKDLGMSVLGRVLRHLLRRRRERLMLLVGTSGDTGSSAMEAVRGTAHLHPHPHPTPTSTSTVALTLTLTLTLALTRCAAWPGSTYSCSTRCRASARSRRCRRCR